jgi:hypothetical protein
MTKFRTASIAFSLSVGLAMVCGPVAVAQTSDAPASTPKQIRQAERKAAKAQTAAELKGLEKNGYNPTNSMEYPKNLDDAQHKVDAAKAAQPAAASAR